MSRCSKRGAANAAPPNTNTSEGNFSETGATLQNETGARPEGPLVRALAEAFGSDRFDELSVGVAACRDTALINALGFLRPALNGRGSWRDLTLSARLRVGDWLADVADHEFDGLVLLRDSRGWCLIERLSK